MNKNNLTESHAIKMDQQDPLRSCRTKFHIPEFKGQPSIYMCGNSLGLQPKSAWNYVREEIEDWAKLGVEGHMHARHPWMPYHEFVTVPMAELVGAKPSEVVVMNSLTANLHFMMVSFYRPKKKRRKILIEENAFPSDRYAVESQLRFHGYDPDEDLIIWKSDGEDPILSYDTLQSILDEEGEHIAMMLIGGVNYYTGQFFDLKRLAEMGHAVGATVGIDLAHGAGNVPLKLHDSGVDWAAWCSYKYLNAGPGGLSGVFVHERHAENYKLPRFSGWWGHNKETRFKMPDEFDIMPGAEGWQLSNPPILPLATLRASLDIFTEVGMDNLRAKSVRLTQYLEDLIKDIGHDSIRMITPTDPDARGCQVSIQVKNADKSLFDFISERGVIADWREPDVIRVAPVPLYNSFHDVFRFVQILRTSLNLLSKS